MEEAVDPDFATYESLSDWFGRPLKPELRPISDADIVSFKIYIRYFLINFYCFNLRYHLVTEKYCNWEKWKISALVKLKVMNTTFMIFWDPSIFKQL